LSSVLAQSGQRPLGRQRKDKRAVLDAYSYSFHNTVVEECTYDRSMITHKVNLFDLHHKYADVMHIEDVLAHLDGLAGQRKVA
jgi:maleamate amidohydrolase